MFFHPDSEKGLWRSIELGVRPAMAEAWEQQLGLCTSGDELIKVFEEIEAALRDRTIEEPISKAW